MSFHDGDYVRHKHHPDVVWQIISMENSEQFMATFRCRVVHVGDRDNLPDALTLAVGMEYPVLRSSMEPVTPLEVLAIAAL